MDWEGIRKIHTWLPESSDGFVQHPNGGGWVRKDHAMVAKNVLLSEAAIVTGGAIHRGIIHGGTIHGGTIHGGTIYDGDIHGGEIRGGVVRKSPLLVTGLLPWPCSTSGPNILSIGCCHYVIAEWERDVEGIAKAHNETKHVDVIRRFVIPMFAAWFRDHPDAITETVV